MEWIYGAGCMLMWFLCGPGLFACKEKDAPFLGAVIVGLLWPITLPMLLGAYVQKLTGKK